MDIGALFLFTPSGQSPGGGMTIFLIQMLAILAIFYFLIIRPKVQQEKRHRERLDQIKRGDEIVTAGGVIGEVVHLKDDRLTVKSGESRLIVQRNRIAEVRGPGESSESRK
ncbi:MAG: preprotein translocase subunit YajC [Gemmatimonadota bacterium]|nr:MAG: preprotein translocase subunit YajC [Gemmatimonadota bacterium]